jgi:hypothetical protein
MRLIQLTNPVIAKAYRSKFSVVLMPSSGIPDFVDLTGRDLVAKLYASGKPETILASLSTQDGSLELIGPYALSLDLSASKTAVLPVGLIGIDLSLINITTLETTPLPISILAISYLPKTAAAIEAAIQSAGKYVSQPVVAAPAPLNTPNALSHRIITSNYTSTASDYIIEIDTTLGPVTLSLLASVPKGTPYRVAWKAGTHPATITSTDTVLAPIEGEDVVPYTSVIIPRVGTVYDFYLSTNRFKLA